MIITNDRRLITDPLRSPTGLGTVNLFQERFFFKFQDVYLDIKPRKHSEKVALESSENTVITQNQ